MFNGEIKYSKKVQIWEDNTVKSHQHGWNLKTTRPNQVRCSTLLPFELPKQHKLAFLSSDCLRRLWIASSGITYSSCCFHKFSWSKSQVIIHLNSGLNSIDRLCYWALQRHSKAQRTQLFHLLFSKQLIFLSITQTRTDPMSNADTLNFIHSSYSSLMNTDCIQVSFL